MTAKRHSWETPLPRSRAVTLLEKEFREVRKTPRFRLRQLWVKFLVALIRLADRGDAYVSRHRSKE